LLQPEQAALMLAPLSALRDLLSFVGDSTTPEESAG
jgi:hypothetical protein